jgi:hypothetical protein
MMEERRGERHVVKHKWEGSGRKLHCIRNRPWEKGDRDEVNEQNSSHPAYMEKAIVDVSSTSPSSRWVSETISPYCCAASLLTLPEPEDYVQYCRASDSSTEHYPPFLST